MNNEMLLDSILSGTVAISAGLIAWFMKRFISNQDERNRELALAIDTLKASVQSLDKVGSEFGRGVDFKLERLDGKTRHWIEKLDKLSTHAADLSLSLYKIDTRIDTVTAKLDVLDERIKNMNERMLLLAGSMSQLKPGELLISQFQDSLNVVNAMAERFEKMDQQIKTMQVQISANTMLITSKKK